MYGTTADGGANNNGTVFKITSSGERTTIHRFAGYPTDGANPYSGLVQAPNGDFYGTTFAGGTYGAGTVFKMTPNGKLAILYSFCAQSGCTDGGFPYAGLVQTANGDFYGTTYDGGTNCVPEGGCGTVFKIAPSGKLTTVYSFAGYPTDGSNPSSALVEATNGNLYGTASYGGANCAPAGCGTVFKVTPRGALTTLHSFAGYPTDGASIIAGLIQAANGDFYGTASFGGANCAPNGCGTVFKITPGGTLTTLHNFCAQSACTDGAAPLASLIQATDGGLYGTTLNGGVNGPPGYGAVFKITPNGSLTTLYSFCSQSGCADGAGPEAALVQATNGTFYGTASYGGTSYGAVFSLSVGLGPFVKTQTTSGKVGAVVKILGTGLTGATGVSFSGTAAVFTVVSPSLIKTTVPAGATSGKVEVVTPSGTLASNVPFRVRP